MAHIWADQVFPLNRFRLLLWQLIFLTLAQYLADKLRSIWQFYIPVTLRANHLADQVLTDLPPHQMAISQILQIPVLTALYSAYNLADQVSRFQMAISQIPLKFIFHSYSESSTFGWPGLGRSNPPFHRFLLWLNFTIGRLTDLPPQMTIAALTVRISFLLWELIIWQTRSWHIYPPIKWQFHRFLLWQLPTQVNIWQTRSFRSDPPHQMEISLIPEKFIFHSYSESSTFGWPGLGRSTHPHQMAISQIPALLWKLIFVRPSVGRSTPTHQW